MFSAIVKYLRRTRLQIVSIQQILDGEQMNLVQEVIKKAKKDDQPSLLGE